MAAAAAVLDEMGALAVAALVWGEVSLSTAGRLLHFATPPLPGAQLRGEMVEQRVSSVSTLAQVEEVAAVIYRACAVREEGEPILVGLPSLPLQVVVAEACCITELMAALQELVVAAAEAAAREREAAAAITVMEVVGVG